MNGRGSGSATSSYQDALRLLAFRRRPGRPVRVNKDEIDPQTPRHGTPDLRGTPSIVGMRDWLRILGHSDADLKALNVIHIAGTKGKGSTCALTESLLRAYGRRTGFPTKTGLYTSPHLIIPQERIRINFQPLQDDQFSKYFFEVYNKLEQTIDSQNFSKAPRYLQMWALIAFHAFIREKIDVAIIETHHGGEYDATNFIEQPVVSVVTTLGMDHVEQLGPELSNIAWHKAGVFKASAAAVSAPQESEAMIVLKERAEEKGVQLEVARLDDAIPAMAKLPAEVLRMNCSVALTAVNAWLCKLDINEKLSTADIEEGISTFSWPGRFQIIQHDHIQWCLDAAHNELSIEKAAQWFAEISSREQSLNKTNILIFSHISSHRDGGKILKALISDLKNRNVLFDSVILTTYAREDSSKTNEQESELSDPSEAISYSWNIYSKIWLEHYPESKVFKQKTIDGAVSLTQTLQHDNLRVLATGSQHLLGGILRLLPCEDQTASAP